MYYFIAQAPVWLTPVGWVVTFVLGIISAVVVQKVSQKRRRISWSLLSETELFSEEIARATSLPIRVMVGNSESTSLSAVNIRIGNTGNEVVEKLTIPISFNESATILKHDIENELGEYGNHVSRTVSGSTIKLQLGFINPKQIIDLEVLLGGYDPGSLVVDLAAPGVELKREEKGSWEISSGFLKSIALSMFGIRYDPTVSPLIEVSETLRSINRKIDRIPQYRNS